MSLEMKLGIRRNSMGVFKNTRVCCRLTPNERIKSSNTASLPTQPTATPPNTLGPNGYVRNKAAMSWTMKKSAGLSGRCPGTSQIRERFCPEPPVRRKMRYRGNETRKKTRFSSFGAQKNFRALSRARFIRLF